MERWIHFGLFSVLAIQLRSSAFGVRMAPIWSVAACFSSHLAEPIELIRHNLITGWVEPSGGLQRQQPAVPERPGVTTLDRPGGAWRVPAAAATAGVAMRGQCAPPPSNEGWSAAVPADDELRQPSSGLQAPTGRRRAWFGADAATQIELGCCRKSPAFRGHKAAIRSRFSRRKSLCSDETGAGDFSDAIKTCWVAPGAECLIKEAYIGRF